jgi:hypothetical protein
VACSDREEYVALREIKNSAYVLVGAPTRLLIVIALSLLSIGTSSSFAEPPAPATPSTISLMQTAGTSDDTAASSISQSFTSSNAAGNLIVVVASWGDSPAPAISATDTHGNSYLVATSDYDTRNLQGLAILYASNIVPGANTVTVNFGNADHYRRIVISEYSGVATASPLDAIAKRQATATTTSNGVTSSAGTTTTGGDLIFGAVMDDSGSFGNITAGTGFTRRFILNNIDTATVDTVQSTQGPITATFTFSLTDHYLAQMAAFRAAASGTGGTSQFSLACTPTTLTSGAASTCTITTTQPAPSGGNTFPLSSNNPSLTVPGSVTVPGGSSSASFAATAGTVASNQTITVTATSNAFTNKTSSATITVTAAPPPISVSVTPPSASVQVTQTAPFTAAVQNDALNRGVTWSLSGAGCSGTACGTLSNITASSVTYTAPTSVPAPASVTLTATSVSDSTKTAGASITITSAAPPPPGTPTLVQRTSASNTQSGSPNSYTLRLPNGTQRGNCIIVGLQFARGYGVSSIAVTDDLNDPYTVVLPQPGNNDGFQVLNAAYALNVAAGARVITITLIGGMPTHVAAAAFEYSNIAISNALDASTTNSGSGSSITAGNLSTTADNDLLWQYSIQDTSSSTVTSWTAGPSPWTLRTADDLDSQAVQDQLQSSAGASNPTISMSPSATWNTVAIALKSASAGSSAPPGIRVVGIQHYAVATDFASNPITVQFPCSGNLIVAVWLGIGGYDISRITDNHGNSYNSTGPVVEFGTSGDAQVFHADNTTCASNLQLQVSTTGANTSGGSELVLYDISGAAASPFDALGTLTGSQNSAANVTTVSVTPSTANGLVIAMLTVESNTITGVSPGLFDAATTLPDVGISPLDQNGGLAHNYNAAPGPELFVWTTSGGAVANWASIAVAFKAQ